jgi:hypothetical protein
VLDPISFKHVGGKFPVEPSAAYQNCHIPRCRIAHSERLGIAAWSSTLLLALGFANTLPLSNQDQNSPLARGVVDGYEIDVDPAL